MAAFVFLARAARAGIVAADLFGIALDWRRRRLLGLIAVLVGWFIVAPIKGFPIAGGWVPMSMLRSIVINGFFGIGVGLILPLLMPRSLVRAHP